MGQTISAQPKLSGEMTLNRIRTACQRDDSMPTELKKFNVQLLVNDMNTLGFDIPIKDSRGKEYGPDELCREIKKKALPDVEELCMMNASKKGEAVHAVEQMVNMFNKYYGARVQLYKNPLDKSRGKRGVQELCDDLYMVMDKMRRRLADRPGEIKNKLKHMIAELEYKKQMIDGQFGAMMSNLRMAKDQDKMDEKLKLAETLQKIVSDELGKQTHLAKEEFSRLVKELESGVKGPAAGLGAFPSEMSKLENKLRGFREIRFMDARDEKVKRLLDVIKASAPAVQSCQRCLDKFGMKMEAYLADDEKSRANFSARMEAKFKQLMKETKDNRELRDLVSCYQQLLDEREQCKRGTAFESELNVLKKDHPYSDLKDIDSVAALVVSTWKRGPLVAPPTLAYGAVDDTDGRTETAPSATQSALVREMMAKGMSQADAENLASKLTF